MDCSRALISLSTKRLSLRVLESLDVSEDYVYWLSDSEVNRYLEARWTDHSLASVEHQVDLLFQSGTDVLFGIYIGSQSNVHIGNIKLSEINETRGTAEVGFLIGRKEYWGKGIASEAITRVCEWAFFDLDLKKITAGAYSVNLGSIKTLEKVGFERERVLRDHVQLDSTSRCDVYRFALLPNRKRN